MRNKRTVAAYEATTPPTNKNDKMRERRDKEAALITLSEETADQPSCFLPLKEYMFAVFENPSGTSERKV
jgi:hypothetical protein